MNVLHKQDPLITCANETLYTDRTNGGYSGLFFDVLNRLRECPYEHRRVNKGWSKIPSSSWDGNQHGRPLWLAPVTFDTLRFTQQSSHFAVDYKQAWQLLPMYQTVVQQSYGARGYNWESINIEMAR